MSVWLSARQLHVPYKTTAYQFHSLKTPSGHHADQRVETSGGQRCLFPSLLCSHEDLHQHGRLRQQEDQTQAEEVPDPPSDAAGRQRQGIHQRYQRGMSSALWGNQFTGKRFIIVIVILYICCLTFLVYMRLKSPFFYLLFIR